MTPSSTEKRTETQVAQTRIPELRAEDCKFGKCTDVIETIIRYEKNNSQSNGKGLSKSKLQKKLGLTPGGRQYAAFNRCLHLLERHRLIRINQDDRTHYLKLTKRGKKYYRKHVLQETNEQYRFPHFVFRIHILNWKFYLLWVITSQIALVYTVWATQRPFLTYVRMVATGMLYVTAYVVFRWLFLREYRNIKRKDYWMAPLVGISNSKWYYVTIPAIFGFLIFFIGWPFPILFLYHGIDPNWSLTPYPVGIYTKEYFLFMMIAGFFDVLTYGAFVSGSLFFADVLHHHVYFFYKKIIELLKQHSQAGNEKDTYEEFISTEISNLTMHITKYIFLFFFIGCVLMIITILYGLFLTKDHIYFIIFYIETYLLLFPGFIALLSLLRYWFHLILQLRKRKLFGRFNPIEDIYIPLTLWAIQIFIVLFIFPILTYVFFLEIT